MIVYYITLAISFLLIAFVIRHKRNAFYNLAEYSVGLLDKIISDLDEDAKITAIGNSNKRLLKAFLDLFIALIIAFILGSIPVITYSLLTKSPFQTLSFSSFPSILSISIGATIPFLIPVQKKGSSDYSELSMLLHKIALDNYNIAYKLFKKECKKITKKQFKPNSNFVIISGLARAGTTSLMNDLSKIKDFATLNYANMPFVLSPNIWRKFYKPKTNQLKERSHKDGIMIGYDSNEALEEFFFKVKAKDAYITNNQLREYNISPDDYEDYLTYHSIIKQDEHKIYLAKNNNFLLRYNSLRSYNDNFIMVILFRDPLKHAASLLEKHKDYKQQQQEDDFILSYMNWLGHHEFGLNQKPFAFNNALNLKTEDKDHIDYWLEIWINYYSYILTINHRNTFLVSYDSYCQNPQAIIRKITDAIDLTTDLPEYPGFNNQRSNQTECSADLLQKANELYLKLQNLSTGS